LFFIISSIITTKYVPIIIATNIKTIFKARLLEKSERPHPIPEGIGWSILVDSHED
jgi:hypothetical protein